MRKCNTTYYEGQDVYCGIDVHKLQWNVSFCVHGLVVKSFQMDPSARGLADYCRREFAGARMHSAYEAGFCGFGAHRALVASGIDNIVVNPADIPTTGKERASKCDRVDCRKLARHLADGSLTAIYVPDESIEHLRGLVRRETQIRDAATRAGNQLKGALYFHGLQEVPARLSNRALDAIDRGLGAVKSTTYKAEIRSHLRLVRQLRRERMRVIEDERKAVRRLGLEKRVELLQGIPGIGFRTAVILLSELGDIGRFRDFDRLAAYVGLSPHAFGSGEAERDRASGGRKKKELHYLMVQAAWVSVRTDAGMCAYYGHVMHRRGKSSTRAIVSVAKKLLGVVYAVLTKGLQYDRDRLFRNRPEIMRSATGRMMDKCRERSRSALSSLVNEEDAILEEADGRASRVPPHGEPAPSEDDAGHAPDGEPRGRKRQGQGGARGQTRGRPRSDEVPPAASPASPLKRTRGR